MNRRAAVALCALLAGCATHDSPLRSNANTGLANPYTSPEIPEIYETAPNVNPPAK